MISKRHWLIAGAAALSMHAVGFYAVFHHAPEGSKGAGAQGIEFDLGMMGDLGAAAQNTLAQQEKIEPKKVVEEPLKKEPEKVVPKKPEPKPVVKKPEPKPEPKPIKKPEPKPVEKKPEPVQKPVIKPKPPVVVKQKSPVVVPKAVPKPKVEPKPKPIERVKPTPKVEPKPTPKPVVPTEAAPTKTTESTKTSQVVSATPQKQGPKSQASQKATTGSASAASNGGNPGAKAKYFTQLAAALAQNKRYPRASRRRNEEGVVTLAFTAYADGEVSDAKIVKSSGYRRLDKAVLVMLKRSVPLPKFSADMPEKELKITLPVSFKLSDY